MDPASLSNVFIKKFQKNLINWSRENPRPMPWKETKDPYHIWLSEIILQQTRVQQGWEYFLRFKKAFPTVHDLADAKERQVLNLWQGLGYYSRARNLHATARMISGDYDGNFPTEPDGLLKLKGVGRYSADAIASFAFDYPAAVVDGNVYRVFSRLFGINTPIDSTGGKKEFKYLADTLLAPKRPAEYNQALIDFGAVQCKPKFPLCHTCPFQEECSAYQNNEIALFPVKSKSIKRKDRFFNYLVLQYDDRLLLRHRQDKDIWQGLYDFPAWESSQLLNGADLKKHFQKSQLLPKQQKGILSPPKKQILTHQTIYAQFYQVEIDKPSDTMPGTIWVPIKSINSYAFPRIIDLYLADKHLYLNLQ